ncbi:serine protease [Streptomyces sp. DT2A-34]|uniref:S1 family peptidase n=1 Tax=Streptomyces sp. DT2A-34 TaxID=3051182 RepID=UPI00265B9D54|nr:serine protease [Streptomyces sp. DT2A-34]MDO0913215.1 serine protease [Streptomyces sp. DT2A-34]
MFKHKRRASGKKKATIFGLAATGVAVAAVVAATSSQAIVGGETTEVEKNSALVMIQYSDGYFCTGSAISHTVIVTSGACLLGSEELSNITVIAGRDNALDEKQGIKRTPDGWWLPAKYSDYSWSDNKGKFSDVPTNDIAAIHLSEPLPSDYKTVDWVPSGFKYKAGTPARILGWGTTSEEQEETTGELREANIEVLPNSDCQSVYKDDYKSGKMVCAGKPDGGVDACKHDRGGPLLISDGKEERLAGIVSWADGCARADGPGVYTKVSTWAKDLAHMPN